MNWGRRQVGERQPLYFYVILALSVVSVGAGWMWLRGRGYEPETLGSANAVANASDEAPSGPRVPPLNLPELDASDAFLRNLFATLSGHPELARWLVTDELARRFVLSVVELAGGRSPRAHVPFLIPQDTPVIGASGEALTIDPASYQRYDLMAVTVASLDTEGTAQLYLQLRPLFIEAYAELGIPGGSFDDAVALAVGNVLAARTASGSIEVRRNEAVYEYVDPNLEARTPLEKHLIRMGPENATQVKNKARDVWAAVAALGAPEAP